MIVFLLAAVIVSLMSCVSDVRSLRIPNWQPLIITALFVPAYFLAPELFHKFGFHVAAFVAMFVVTYGLFLRGFVGGGDAKLVTALALWVGLQGLMAFMFYMAIFGGVLGGFALYLRNKKPFKKPTRGGWVETAQKGGNALPYGVAITFGAWMALLHTGAVHNHLNEVFKIIH